MGELFYTHARVAYYGVVHAHMRVSETMPMASKTTLGGRQFTLFQ